MVAARAKVTIIVVTNARKNTHISDVLAIAVAAV
jgi:hypothetical protein